MEQVIRAMGVIIIVFIEDPVDDNLYGVICRVDHAADRRRSAITFECCTLCQSRHQSKVTSSQSYCMQFASKGVGERRDSQSLHTQY